MSDYQLAWKLSDTVFSRQNEDKWINLTLFECQQFLTQMVPYIYIYIYMCVCVCVCVWIINIYIIKRVQFINWWSCPWYDVQHFPTFLSRILQKTDFLSNWNDILFLPSMHPSCDQRVERLYLEQNVWSTGDSVRGRVSAWHTNGSLIRILRARQDGFVKLVHANRVGELVNSPRMPQSFIWLLLVHHGRIDLTAAIWEMSLNCFF